MVISVIVIIVDMFKISCLKANIINTNKDANTMTIDSINKYGIAYLDLIHIIISRKEISNKSICNIRLFIYFLLMFNPQKWNNNQFQF